MELASTSCNVLGTAVEAKLPKSHSSLFLPIFSCMKRIEASYSRFLENSELSRLNSNLGSWQGASDELIFLLEAGERFRLLSEGHFDLCVKEALDALGYDSKYTFREDAQALRALSIAAGGREGAIQIDKKAGKVMLMRQVDFGGIGKGYALDAAAAIIEAAGLRHYYINAGGDIIARSADGEPKWEILLEHPDDETMAIGKVMLDGMAIAGSAPNRRKWGGHHHLLSAKTLMPAKDAKCIFVLAKKGIDADAYATALFGAGFNDGIRLAKKLGLEILFVSKDDKMYTSPGFDVMLFE